MRYSRALFLPVPVFLACLPAYPQSVVSVRSGVINYFEGAVFLDDQPLAEKFAAFPSIKQGSTLRTEKGRAEVLLTPGVFLRIDENSTVRMISTSFSDTQAELVSGSAILDSLEAASEKSPAVLFQRGQVHFPKKGVYRFDSEPAAVLHVYDGEAEVTQEGKRSVVDTSHLYFFAAAAPTNKFGEDADDNFSRWAEERSGAVAAQNQLSADSGRNPADWDNDGTGAAVDPGSVFAVPNYGGAPGIAPPGGMFFPFYPAGTGLWGFSPIYPLFLFVPYRNLAYPRQPNRPSWPHPGSGGTWITVSGDRWRNRPGYPTGSLSGYPHSPGLTSGLRRPFSPRPVAVVPRPTPQGIGTGGGFSRYAASTARPGAASVAAHGVRR